MYRLSELLAKEILNKIKTPEMESSGPNAFLPKNLKSVGVIDPICCVGSVFPFLIESPIPVMHPDLPYLPVGVRGYFLYKREELLQPMDSWPIQRVFVDPLANDAEETIDVKDSSIILGSDVDKLVAPTITTLEQLIKKEPLILDCLDLGRK